MLTPEEAAERISVHPETIRRMIRDGRLQASKPGGRYWRIDPADLARLTGAEPDRSDTIQPHHKIDAVIEAARRVVDDPTPRNIVRLGVVTANLAAAARYDERTNTPK